MRNALRQKLPAAMIEGDQPLSGNIDALVPIDDSTFFVKGWMRDGEAEITRLTAVTAEGERVELLERIFRLELPEFEVFAEGPYREPVDAARFVAHFETSRPSLLRKAWVFEMQNETGPRRGDVRAARYARGRPRPHEGPAQRGRTHDLPDEELMSNHIFPAVQRLQERARESVAVASVTEHGALPESPDVSIVVPLYQRIDLVEHQLLQFNRDPEIRAQDLIYVLDSPELESAMADQARQLADLYSVPFRVVTMAENAGFGAATNAGASVARGRLLLLLNSDVLPAAAGLARHHAGVPRRHPEHRGARPQAPVRGRLAAARRPVLRAVARGPDRGVVGEHALLQGPAQGPSGGQRRPPGAGRHRGLPDDRKGPLRAGRGPAGRLRAGRLRGLRAMPAAARRGPRELVPPLSGALPPRRELVFPGREGHHGSLQPLAPDPQVGPGDRRRDGSGTPGSRRTAPFDRLGPWQRRRSSTYCTTTPRCFRAGRRCMRSSCSRRCAARTR